jgi:vacuolar protein sorting-associated protein 72
VKKARYAGPLLRLRSRRVGGEELTTLEVRNMQAPAEYSRRAAPPPPPRALCAVTGAPARYRDPLTGLPYADAAAFAELRRRAAAAAAAAEAAAAEAARQEAELAARPRYRAW